MHDSLNDVHTRINTSFPEQLRESQKEKKRKKTVSKLTVGFVLKLISLLPFCTV